MNGVTKVCRCCEKDLPVTEFCKNKPAKDGLNCYCRGCAKLRYAEHYKKNVEAMRARSAEYRKQNPEAVKQKLKEWQERNATHTAEYRKRNKEKMYLNGKRYRERNIDKVRSGYAERRAAMQSPAWADKEAIRQFYAEAAMLSRERNVPHEVDHIVPLRSPIVCGLHCEFNLRVVTMEENRKKSNLFWPDMPSSKKISQSMARAMNSNLSHEVQ